jgi:hypothetical protein
MAQKKTDIPKELLYIHNLFNAFYGYICFDCFPCHEFDVYKYVVGFSPDPPRGSCVEERTIAMVSECPKCFRIFWLHCEGKEIEGYLRYKKKMAESGVK